MHGSVARRHADGRRGEPAGRGRDEVVPRRDLTVGVAQVTPAPTSRQDLAPATTVCRRVAVSTAERLLDEIRLFEAVTSRCQTSR